MDTPRTQSTRLPREQRHGERFRDIDNSDTGRPGDETLDIRENRWAPDRNGQRVRSRASGQTRASSGSTNGIMLSITPRPTGAEWLIRFTGFGDAQQIG